jgi:hypothetical protein
MRVEIAEAAKSSVLSTIRAPRMQVQKIKSQHSSVIRLRLRLRLRIRATRLSADSEQMRLRLPAICVLWILLSDRTEELVKLAMQM